MRDYYNIILYHAYSLLSIYYKSILLRRHNYVLYSLPFYIKIASEYLRTLLKYYCERELSFQKSLENDGRTRFNKR